MNGTKPEIAHRKGFYFEVKAGERYFWCSCGRSKSQPFCDGSHAGTGFLPVAFKAERDEEVIFCGCKHTRSAPFCDGSHMNLPGGYRTDDPESLANRRVAWLSRTAVRLCVSTDSAMSSPPHAPGCGTREPCATAPWSVRRTGAFFQSQFYARVSTWKLARDQRPTAATPCCS